MALPSFRFVELPEIKDSYHQMAVDEAVMIAVAEGKSMPSLYIHPWPERAVAIGFFQSVEEEVNVEYCVQHSIRIFRRMTGGGAVYKYPEGELNYSIIIPENFMPELRDIVTSYGVLCQPIIDALKKLGMDASFRPVNDVVVAGRKISGNAQTRKKGVVFQHGTILLDFDVDTMLNVLKISREKLKDKVVDDLKRVVTTVKEQLGYVPSFDEFSSLMRESFEDVLGVRFVDGKLTPYELELAEKLYNEKYSTRGWNFWR